MLVSADDKHLYIACLRVSECRVFEIWLRLTRGQVTDLMESDLCRAIKCRGCFGRCAGEL